MIRTLHAMRPCLAVLAILACAASLAAAQAGIAPTGDPGQGFDIEGNLEANTPNANTTDWVPGVAGTGVGVMTSAGVPVDPSQTFHAVDAYGSGDDVFTGALSRLNNNPNSWAWVTTLLIPGKHDPNHGLVHVSADASGHRWLVWAADRMSSLGSSFINCELLQNTLLKNGNGTFSSAGLDGGRTVGDLVLTMQVDAVFVLPPLVLRWQEVTPGAFDFVSLTPAAGTVFFGSNTSSTAPVPYGAFGSTTYAASLFGEMALDLTALLAGIQPSAQFRTILISTRTSAQNSASVIDFISPVQVSFAVGVEDLSVTELALGRIAPNPSSSRVQIEFAVARESRVRLGVFDVAGREVARLAEGIYGPGRHRVVWNGTGNPAGVYFMCYQVGAKIFTRRVALVR